MTKTIQVQGDEQINNSLNRSLGLLGDTLPPIQQDYFDIDVPFPKYDRELALQEAVAYREAGGVFLTKEESLANLREAIERGAVYGEQKV